MVTGTYNVGELRELLPFTSTSISTPQLVPPLPIITCTRTSHSPSHNNSSFYRTSLFLNHTIASITDLHYIKSIHILITYRSTLST